MAGEATELRAFLEEAGRSLAEAQGSLSGTVPDMPSAMAISDAELELKATVERASGGAIALKPVSGQDVIAGKLHAEALSTVRIRYVAVVDDASAPSQRPTRTAEDVVGVVKARDDIAALDRIFGGLQFDAVFVAPTASWMVTATDPNGRRVRNVVVDDAEQ